MFHKPTIMTPLKRARGLGASHTGTEHFWIQRVSALALIPLTVWFMVALVTAIIDHDTDRVRGWLGQPLSALVMALFIVAAFWHAKIGVQVIVEDYVHHEGRKIATLLVVNALIYGLGAAALMAIAHLHFFGI